MTYKIEFSERELAEIGFELVIEGGEAYWQAVLDKDNYINSLFLATESVEEIDYLMDTEKIHNKWKVISPYNYEGAEYLTLGEITNIISKGHF